MHRLSFLLSLCAIVCAQPKQMVSFSGEVESAPPHFTVELVDLQNHMASARAYGRADGNFRFDSVDSGHYELRVVSDHGQVLRSEFIDVMPSTTHLTVRLTSLPAPDRPVSGVVSVQELSKTRQQSIRFLQSAARFRGRGDLNRALEKDRQAVNCDPNFAGARLELANRYLELSRPWDARNELLEAIRLDPKLVVAYVNLAAADLLRGDAAGAEQAAGGALARDPENKRARYLSALAKWVQGRGPRPAQDAAIASRVPGKAR